MFASILSWIIYYSNDWFYGIITKNMYQYSVMFKYNKILESPSYYYFGRENINSISEEDKLYLKILSFLNENNVFEKGVVISLSGGVDSMVILAILLKIRNEKHFGICAAMINYNLRKESLDEAKFIELYCKKNKVQFYICNMIEGLDSTESFIDRQNMGSKKRNQFEEKSKELRYSFYQKIIKDHDYSGVILGHHKDDITENIFTNILKGHNILDLEVMKEVGSIKEVNIFRPLINFPKNDIINLAINNKIPYFKDTTPVWSRRGKMRFEIFPMLNQVFGKSWKEKIKSIGDQSNLLNDSIKRILSDPWIKNVEWVDEVKFETENSSGSKTFLFLLPVKYKEDLFMWYYTIPQLFFRKKLKSIRRKSIEKLFNILSDETSQYTNTTITLDSGICATIITRNSEQVITFFKKLI